MLNKKKNLVKNFLIPLSKVPVCQKKTLLKVALEKMSKNKIGVCICTNEKGKLIGILTDGDVRRKILSEQKPFSALLNDDLSIHLNYKPFKVNPSKSIFYALKIMKKHSIWDLPVVDNSGILIGICHMQNIVKHLLKK